MHALLKKDVLRDGLQRGSWNVMETPDLVSLNSEENQRLVGQ
jgi:hypothetical protein